MDDKFLISVIVPTYNRADLLGYTLRSLETQQLKKSSFEVIVADDGSTDNTRDIVRNFEKRMNVKYVFQPDAGFRPASVRNKGILTSEGTLCLFIDSGVLLDSCCLTEHINFLFGTRSPAAAIGYVYGFEQEGNDMDSLMELIDTKNPSNTISQFRQAGLFLDVREPLYHKYNDNIESLPAPWTFFWTCNVAVPKRYLLDVGLFDESYDGNWGCEDNDLGIRLHQDKVKIKLNRKAESIHFPHNKNLADKAGQWYTNCLLLHKKFNCRETALFLNNYLNNITNNSTDINEMILQADHRSAELF